MMSISKGDGEGVAANRARKRRLWLLIGCAIAAGVAVDAVIIPMAKHAPAGGPYLSVPAAVIAAAVLVLIATGGVGLYLRWVDELDRQHNIAAFSIGFLFNISAFIAWYLLSEAAVVPRPDAFVLFVSSAAVAALAYCWMKVRTHLG